MKSKDTYHCCPYQLLEIWILLVNKPIGSYHWQTVASPESGIHLIFGPRNTKTFKKKLESEYVLFGIQLWPRIRIHFIFDSRIWIHLPPERSQYGLTIRYSILKHKDHLVYQIFDIFVSKLSCWGLGKDMVNIPGISQLFNKPNGFCVLTIQPVLYICLLIVWSHTSLLQCPQ